MNRIIKKMTVVFLSLAITLLAFPGRDPDCLCGGWKDHLFRSDGISGKSGICHHEDRLFGWHGSQ